MLPLSVILAFGMLTGFAVNMPERSEASQGYYGELVPVIKEKRAELDKSLSKKEKAKVEELKEQMNAVHEKIAEIMASAKAENSKGAEAERGRRIPELTDEQRSQLQDLHWERRKIASEAFAIADAHKQEVMKLTSDIRAKAIELRKERQSDRSGREGNETGQRYRDGKGKNNGPGRGRAGMNFGNMADPAHFILFDAERMGERLEQRKNRGSFKKGN